MNLATLLVTLCALGQEPSPFELRDGDRVVFVGNTFVERDQIYGYLETRLTTRWPDRHVTFRNLGWSGDTVWGEARARFGTAADGFQHLKEHVEALQPSVIFVAYGTNESFRGESGLEEFSNGLSKLLDMLARTEARIVLVAPLRFENLGRPLRDPAEPNRNLKQYATLIEQAAVSRGQRFLNLFEMPKSRDDNGRRMPREPLTDNGMHLSPAGYWQIARTMETELDLAQPQWSLSIDAETGQGEGATITQIERTDRGVRFRLRDTRLPPPPPPNKSIPALHRQLHVRGLKPGKYSVRVNSEELANVNLAPDQPVVIPFGPELHQTEQLRRTIIDKNRLYFHRWRPQNETYLFGFRKHEQGQNAAEIPQFDPLIEQHEQQIAKLRVPVEHAYELVRQ